MLTENFDQIAADLEIQELQVTKFLTFGNLEITLVFFFNMEL